MIQELQREFEKRVAKRIADYKETISANALPESGYHAIVNTMEGIKIAMTEFRAAMVAFLNDEGEDEAR